MKSLSYSLTCNNTEPEAYVLEIQFGECACVVRLGHLMYTFIKQYVLLKDTIRHKGHRLVG